MKKSSSPAALPEAVLIRWASWPLGLQLALFWLAIITGAGLWGTVLWLSAGRPELSDPPPALASAYVAGLYAWLLLICDRGGSALASPAPGLSLASFGRGALLALTALGLFFGLSLGLGWCHLATPRPDWPLIALQVLVMALGVAWIEERIFRGLLLDLGRRRLSLTAALHLQAVSYALVHLLRPLSPMAWLEALAALWLTGLALGRLRRGADLGASVGLHAAWIASTSFCAWSGLYVWEPAAKALSGGGNPAYGLAGLLLILALYLIIRQGSERAIKGTSQAACSRAEAGTSSDAWRQDV